MSAIKSESRWKSMIDYLPGTNWFAASDKLRVADLPILIEKKKVNEHKSQGLEGTVTT